jgi:predicted nucleic acid-binding protein
MSADVAYLDASAFLKLVVREPESAALRRYLRRWPRRASAALLRVEALVQARKHGHEAETQARHLLRAVALLSLDATLLEAASDLAPPRPLRALDAIHVAAARSLGADLGALVTYDERMAQVASDLGLSVAAPA